MSAPQRARQATIPLLLALEYGWSASHCTRAPGMRLHHTATHAVYGRARLAQLPARWLGKGIADGSAAGTPQGVGSCWMGV